MIKGDDSILRSADDSSYRLTIMIVTITCAIWIWALINLPNLKDIAITYMFFASAGAMLLGGLAYVSNNMFPFAVLGVPKLKDVPVPLLVGATFGATYVFVSGGLISLVNTPLFSVAAPFLGLSPLLLIITYGIFAPLAEDMLFAATMLPTSVRMFGKGAGIIGIAFGFTVMHWLFFGGSIALLSSAFIFYVVACALTVYFRSALVCMSAHITYNMLIVLLYLGFI